MIHATHGTKMNIDQITLNMPKKLPTKMFPQMTNEESNETEKNSVATHRG